MDDYDWLTPEDIQKMKEEWIWALTEAVRIPSDILDAPPESSSKLSYKQQRTWWLEELANRANRTATPHEADDER